MSVKFDFPDAALSSHAAPDLGALPEWRLQDLYESMDAPRFAADLERAEGQAKLFAEDYRGKLAELTARSDAGETLAAAVKAYEQLQDLTGRIMAYASLLYASDTSNPAIAKFYGDAQERVTALAGDVLFFELELNRLDDAKLSAAMAAPALGHYRPWLEDIRKEKPHQLADDLERLFLDKSVSSAAAWNRLFDETMAALRFDFEGESLTLEPLLAKLMDPDAKIRETAANALAATLGANLRLFALITNTLAKDKEISDRWRKFKDVADSRHLANRVEPEVVEALVAAVTDGYPRLSHRYYALKARWFGKERLDHWDRNAPLPNAPRRVYKWEAARDMVLGAYGAFSPRMADIARRFFDEGWIDAPVRPGKAPGAFAHPTTPSSHPYILLNFLGKARDVTTLAHELGHGVHQLLAGVNGPLMAPTPLTLAETASVFGEMLTFRSMLATTSDPVERKAMLAAKVEDMLNTVVRQIAFYKFERLVHLERRNGELTTEQISQAWMNTQSESLGPAIALRPGYETYWAYIGHFIHSPFYVYAYAFGDCLVNSLYGVYERSSDGFAERYLSMLAAGGSKSYSELLAPFGLDAKDAGFWKIGLSVIERMIGELEAMGWGTSPMSNVGGLSRNSPRVAVASGAAPDKRAPPMPADVAAAFFAFPGGVRARLLEVRDLIFETAADIAGVGPLKETLKWGEPAYLTEATGSGSTIRLGWLRSSERGCAVLFNCRTTLVDDFRSQFPGVFAYEKNRAILLDALAPLPKAPLSVCLGMALTYHRRR